ncbi:MAG: hypothetical protein KGV51_00360 [Moraxellaceae bacterium]|nr:hypothetical protein [Moraxellaceae bacterium]
MQDVEKIIEEYENLDMTDFPIVEPNVIKKMKQAKADFLKNQQQFFGFETDVADWLSHQDDNTKNYINGMIKNYMSFKNNEVRP